MKFIFELFVHAPQLFFSCYIQFYMSRLCPLIVLIPTVDVPVPVIYNPIAAFVVCFAMLPFDNKASSLFALIAVLFFFYFFHRGS
ncbi:hypothetical protein GLOIN_2v1576051 [Rhizophagus irregularis DAOM 181602=DAOM 197198]|uniref:Uncharacterized protein n=1 Tax=Rhizophagus irregularis (strain DAOM 181602 / DAOM 197198 / MUCL 43194) TaxID=747089 RepID=A0A2P4QA37_RHIID|nr:hypothetical protein GLOIN_2v1576051 [Rhizophagus irregularis DAOM 181602=DAOM 197198]POG74468.1 hypothetical protein GLOIN_2v1576051 [Rhizophagus irregularis DAOM 181602=DAOM 197198]GBC29693.2 hypothetical protein GLOIN_2v1576051 [Rhizophagus irregularis DAOM 181602=DAOM 197198]|eukprot:XP_025181334.1 hypothetical protein GLOIN_2v1576051 [Rhizophagus irregularis DAOM 181602=DAOM 197198]